MYMTTYETCKSPQAAYKVKGINNRCRFLSRLVALKLNLFNSITEYITGLMRLANYLSNIEKDIDDELFISSTDATETT